MKIVKYLVLESLFICFALLWGDMLTNDHKPGEVCITVEWGEQIGNYLEFGWNNYFHWFRDQEKLPCRYETYMLFFYYIFVLIFYSGLKSYGMKKCPQTLTWRVVLSELLFYICLYLFFIIKQDGFMITSGSLLNAFLGSVYFLSPLIIYGVVIIYAFRKM